MSMTAMQNPSDVHSFTLAGKAIVTIASKKTGTRYTYRFVRSDRDANAYFVGLLTGPDNVHDYSYLGMHRVTAAAPITLTKKSKLTCESGPVKAASYFVEHVLQRGVLPANLEVYHEGRCGRCARTLTVPESIERGIGPECAHRLGHA